MNAFCVYMYSDQLLSPPPPLLRSSISSCLVVVGYTMASFLFFAPQPIPPIYSLTFLIKGVLPAAHGSALFSRGDTQVLCAATLGAGKFAT
jgi:hypothetical protein